MTSGGMTGQRPGEGLRRLPTEPDERGLFPWSPPERHCREDGALYSSRPYLTDNWIPKRPQLAGTMRPSGVWQSRRVELTSLFPALRACTLEQWYRVRIACCAFQALDRDDNLVYCQRCDNHGFVCPLCLGARRLVKRGPGLVFRDVQCHGCCDCEPGDPAGTYNVEQLLRTARGWMAARFPGGLLAAIEAMDGGGPEGEDFDADDLPF